MNSLVCCSVLQRFFCVVANTYGRDGCTLNAPVRKKLTVKTKSFVL